MAEVCLDVVDVTHRSMGGNVYSCVQGAGGFVGESAEEKELRGG